MTLKEAWRTRCSPGWITLPIVHSRGELIVGLQKKPSADEVTKFGSYERNWRLEGKMSVMLAAAAPPFVWPTVIVYCTVCPGVTVAGPDLVINISGGGQA